MSTGFELDLSGTTGAADLNIGFESVKEGTFHVGVTDVTLDPQNAKHEYIANALLKLSMEIFGGEPTTEVGKKFSTIFFRPDPNAEKWKFENARNLLARLGKATLVIPADAYGKPVPVAWADMVGKHFVIEMQQGKSKEAGKDGFLNVKGIWHSSSTEVARFVNQEVASEFPMGPDTLARAVNGSASANGGTAASGGAAANGNGVANNGGGAARAGGPASTGDTKSALEGL